MTVGTCVATLLQWFQPTRLTSPSTSIFSRASTPAAEVHDLGKFVIVITSGIFLGIAVLLAYVVHRYRSRPGDDSEPPQVFGSTQIELAWTIIPILIIVVLFLGTARVIFAVQDAPKPPSALDVTVIGHQFWWEFRYPKYNIVTANELHVPLSDQRKPTPTYLKLTSADVMHSFWVPRLAGKTDLLPNRVNEMWIDPHETGLYLGQCAQFCGQQHAKMLLRVYVDTPEQFQRWVAQQQRGEQSGTAGTASRNGAEPAQTGGDALATPSTHTAVAAAADSNAINPEQGRRVFEQQACMNCHAISGTVATGRYGPDLTHLMSRATLASGAVPNTPQTLLAWINDPNDLKPGSLMPAMHLTDTQNAQIVAYLTSLR
jgi:cytochrome c oxidase subunit II